MKKQQLLPVILCMFAASLGSGVSEADFYNRAPDVMPGTIPEMRTPAYWIDQMSEPDAIILAPEEIRARNEAYVEKMSVPDPFEGVHPERALPDNRLNRWPGRAVTFPDIRKMAPDSIAVIARREIQRDIDFMRKQKYGNCYGMEYTAGRLDELEGEMALNLVPDNVVSHDGIAVRTTRLRVVPSFFPEEVGILENGKTRWDIWTANLVKIGRPVHVLHSSRSGRYVFVLSDDGYGWVESQDIAFGHIVEIKAYADPANFVVCTGDRVPFYSDKRCRYASGFLRMGDRIPAASKDNSRIISIPVRSINGKFKTETAWLAEDADVSHGWLPYTRRNIVETAFKLLDNYYDWTMGFLGRNHETTYRDIFACFGFRLPFHGGLFTFFGENETVVPVDAGTETQYAMILENEPFVTLMCCGGHIKLLLRSRDGVPITFDQHGYGYTDEDGSMLEVRRCCINDIRMPEYFLKNPITFVNLK